MTWSSRPFVQVPQLPLEALTTAAAVRLLDAPGLNLLTKRETQLGTTDFTGHTDEGDLVEARD
jgi:hypothetical protein